MNSLPQGLAKSFDSVARAGVPSWVMIGLAIIMFGGWTATYVSTIRKGFRDQSYGIPFPNTCLNFSWELIFSLNWMGGLPPFFFPLRVGHLFWLIPNSFNVYQTLKYGPEAQRIPWLARHFRKVFVGTFGTCFLLVLTYHKYANDVFGVASSWIINVLMSWLFIRMFLDRRNQITADGTVRGMSLNAAWFKLIGNAAGAVFCFYWWPAQFTGGVLVHQGFTIPEPRSWMFLYVLYAVNLGLDVGLIYMLRARERELREARTSAQLVSAR